MTNLFSLLLLRSQGVVALSSSYFRLALLLVIFWQPAIAFAQASSEKSFGAGTSTSEIRDSRGSLQSVSSLQALLNKEPNNSEAHFLLGTLLERNGWLDLADKEFERASQLDPSGPASAVNIFIRKWNNSGRLAAQEFQNHFETIHPHDPSVLLMKAVSSAKLNDFKNAELLFREAVHKFGAVPGVSCCFAEFLLQQHRYDEAIAFANRDLDLKANHTLAGLIKAEALIAKDQYVKALPLLQSIYETSKAREHRMLSARLLCRIYLLKGMVHSALEMAFVELGLIEESPDLPFAEAKHRVVTLLKDNPASVVASDISSARIQIEEFGASADSDFVLRTAQILEHAGYREMSESLYQELINLKAADGWTYFSLARLKELDGDYKSALALYAKSLSLLPAEPSIISRQERLRSRLKNARRDFAWKLKHPGSQLP